MTAKGWCFFPGKSANFFLPEPEHQNINRLSAGGVRWEQRKSPKMSVAGESELSSYALRISRS